MEPETGPLAHEELLADMTWLSRLAHRLVRDPALADDAVQDAWLAATRRLEARGGGAPDRGVLARALRSVLLHARRGANRRVFHERQVPRDVVLPSTEELLEAGEAQQLLWRHVAALDEPFRTTLLLRFQRGLATRDMAERLGVQEDSVRWRVRRGLALLRDSLERDDDANGLVAIVPAAIPALGAASFETSRAALTAAGALLMSRQLITVAAAAAAVLVGALWIGRARLAAPENATRDGASESLALRGTGKSEPADVAASVAPAAGEEMAAVGGDGARSRPVVAGSDSEQGTTVNPTVALLSGRIVGSDGRPIPGAEIEVGSSGWKRSVRSGRDGVFSVECPIQTAPVVQLRVQPGPFLATASLRFGRAPGCDFGALDVAQLDVGDIVQASVGRIVGRVVDDEGQPIHAAAVSLPHFVTTVETDTDGAFLLPGAPEGEYNVVASADGRLTRLAAVDVTAGQIVDAGEIALEPGPTVTGRVVDGLGSPVLTATVSARRATVPVESDGSFLLRGTDLDRVVVTAKAEGYRDSLALWCEPGARVDLVLLPLGGPCSFHVVDAESDEPIQDASVSLDERDEPEGQPSSGSSRRYASTSAGDRRGTDASGRIQLIGLAGVDLVRVEAEGYLPIEAPVDERATGIEGQPLRLARRPTSLVVGELPPGVDRDAPTAVRIEALELLSVETNEWLPRPDPRGSSDWTGAECVLRVASAHRVEPDSAGRFTFRCEPPTALRAVVDLPGRRAMVSGVLVVRGEGTFDVGALMDVRMGSIEVHLDLSDDLRSGLRFECNEQRASRTPVDESGVARFASLLPGRILVSAFGTHPAVEPHDLRRIATVRSGVGTRLELSPNVPDLGRVRFAMTHNGARVETDYFVDVHAGGRVFYASGTGRSDATDEVLIPVGRGYRLVVGLDTPDQSNCACEITRSLDVIGGEQLVELDVRTCRVTCSLPVGWTPPAAPSWQVLHWSDDRGEPREPIDPASHLAGLPVASAETGRFVLEYAMVPVDARNLVLVVEGSGDEEFVRWPVDVELTAGGHAEVSLDGE